MATAVLDGDIIAYQAAAVSQKDIDWGDGDSGPSVDVGAAITSAHRMVRDWTTSSGARSCVIALSGRDGRNFRRMIFPAYKSGRTEKPEAYWPVVDALEASYKVYRIGGLEADDVMGAISTSEKFGDSILVTLDKDLNTIPGVVFNPKKDRNPRRIRLAQADYFWMTQTLTGDQTDGYPGLPGIGAVKAERILSEASLNLQSMWSAVLAAYEARGLTEEDALLQARLARILRRTDYDQATETIKLWHPTKPSSLSLSEVKPWTLTDPESGSSGSQPPALAPASPKPPTRSKRSATSSSSSRRRSKQ